MARPCWNLHLRDYHLVLGFRLRWVWKMVMALLSLRKEALDDLPGGVRDPVSLRVPGYLLPLQLLDFRSLVPHVR